MLAAFGQEQIAGPERIPDRKGQGDLPGTAVNLAVLDQETTPGGGNEAVRIVGFELRPSSDVEITENPDRRHQRLAADSSLERQGHEGRQVLAQCAVPGQHGIEMTAFL